MMYAIRCDLDRDIHAVSDMVEVTYQPDKRDPSDIYFGPYANEYQALDAIDIVRLPDRGVTIVEVTDDLLEFMHDHNMSMRSMLTGGPE